MKIGKRTIEAEVEEAIVVSIIVRISLAITYNLTGFSMRNQTVPTPIITMIPTKIVTSVRNLTSNPTVVVVMLRATQVIHAHVVAHAVVVGLHSPLLTVIIMNMLRGALTGVTKQEAVLLPPIAIIHLLSVEESYLGGDISAQKRKLCYYS